VPDPSDAGELPAGNASPTGAVDGQPELPFGVDLGRGTAASASDEVEQWPGYRALAGHPVVGLPGLGQVAVLTGTFVMRWLLRLTLPIAGAAALLHLLPYRGTAAGVNLSVEGTLLTRPGLTADTTFGNWEFPHVDSLPIGIHIRPQNVDLLRLARSAPDTERFAHQLRDDVTAQAHAITVWIGLEILVGALLGLAVAAGINMAVRYLRGHAKRPGEGRRRAMQLAWASAVAAAVAIYGVATFNPDWTKQSRLTGTLGAVQLVPDQLARFYAHQSKVYDVLGAIASIQAQLQDQIAEHDTPPASFNIMYLSDMHLAATYPLVQQYSRNFDVKLIINTGDESEFGRAPEITATYRDQIASITRTVPMIWLAGNHDSPEVAAEMAGIPGVTVVGSKTADGDTFRVAAQKLTAYGLTIGALPDPRVYGAPGAYGSDQDSTTDPLERTAVDDAVQHVTDKFDIFATHEPVAARQLIKDLPGQIRETAAGHTHRQNDAGDLQKGRTIELVEGSTGAGGLDAINRSTPAPPVEFSIQTVALNCQFTKIVRFQLDDASPDDSSAASVYGQQVRASTVYFGPQQLESTRRCTLGQGISAIQDVVPRGVDAISKPR
jgi:Calcineurin-like phosphoesterase